MIHVLASQSGPDSWNMCHLSGRIHILYQWFPGAVPNNAYQTNFNSRYYEDISKFTKVEMKKGKSEILELCHNGTFCCQASYNISNTNNAR